MPEFSTLCPYVQRTQSNTQHGNARKCQLHIAVDIHTTREEFLTQNGWMQLDIK